MKKFAIAFLVMTIVWQGTALACESCLCSLIGRRDQTVEAQKWFFDLTVEQQNWEELPVDAAHELHENGHHVHDKTNEEFYHFQGGFHPVESVTVFLEMPYVVREMVEIEAEDLLGQHETSEGFGDLSLVGVWRFLQRDGFYLGVTGGEKFPTGSTGETNSRGELFEIEMQPGSGSYDTLLGGVFGWSKDALSLRGNAVYTFKGEGARDFEYGDLFSASLSADYALNPDAKVWKASAGMDLHYQNEDKQKALSEDDPSLGPMIVADSGGDALFWGPSLTIAVNEHSVVYGSFLAPVFQNPGGVHQELDYIWTAGARISW